MPDEIEATPTDVVVDISNQESNSTPDPTPDLLEEEQEQPQNPTPSFYDSTLQKLKEKVSTMTIRPNTLYLLIRYVMEAVEETTVKGTAQKELSLKLMRALIVDLTDGEDEKVLLQLLNDGTLGNMIDLIVDATHGNLNINTLSNVGTGCFTRCFPYLFSKSKKTKK